ncbi:hypothetical protein KIW84_070186 [Lathyrus oleraceus]|uniref:Uncharacterized protein n=1 Tax=Pisum sativum TaxID=3888 RepID=A0A9D4VH98_PEA|nr:hypothetical protein KIW84_070186 [Pisum sativum]
MRMEIVSDVASLDFELLHLPEVSTMGLKSNFTFVQTLYNHWLSLPETNRLATSLLNDVKSELCLCFLSILDNYNFLINSDEPSLEAINSSLWKQGENLKSDRKTLTQELVKLRSNLNPLSKLLLLSDRLDGMEKHQQQMISFLVMVIQCPGFLAQLLHPKENNWRFAEQGNMWDHSSQDDEPIPSDGMIVKYKPPVSETLKPIVLLSSAFEPEPELSTDGQSFSRKR